MLVRTCLLIVAIVSWPMRTLHANDAERDRPNFLVILCDDLGYGDLGITGHPYIRTPHLDQLARDGMLFSDFYSAAPVCSPSRVGLLTGRSPNRAGVYDWIPEAGEAKSDAREQVHMRRDELTIGQLLKSAGYATCMAGKWHCNSDFNSPSQPQPGDAGFDHWLATQNNAAPRHLNPVNYVRNGKPVGLIEGFSCRIAAEEAASWITRQNTSAPEQPFFVYVPFHEPHEPVESPAKLVEKYMAVCQSEDQAQYFANVENMDSAVGHLLTTLNDLNLRERTLIVFSSDNGPETLNRYRNANRSWGSTGHLRGMKLHTHDGGFHVVGIANWMGTIGPGRVESRVVSALDLLPTFAALADAELPETKRFDGVDISPVLAGTGDVERSQPLVWAYYNGINEARVAMRHGRWKVLARLDGGTFPKLQNLIPRTLEAAQAAALTDFEIYNASEDPGETQNLFGRGLAEQDELIALIEAEYRRLAAESPAWVPKTATASR